MKINYKTLVEEALKAKEKAYAPYSGLRVGAALLGENGKIFTGVNVENVSFGATCCAERTAVFSAVTEGVKDFLAIAVASDLDTVIFPCGICRQVMVEFKIPKVLVSDNKGNYKLYTLEELQPYSFKEF